MKINYFNIIVVVISVNFGGCASYGKITPLPSDGQETQVECGVSSLVSKKDFVVKLVPEYNNLKGGFTSDYLLVLKNNSDNHAKFSITDISAANFNPKSMKSKNLKVFDRTTLMESELNTQELKLAWEAIGLVVNSIDMSQYSRANNINNTHNARSDYEYRVSKLTRKSREKIEELKNLLPNEIEIAIGKQVSGKLRVKTPKLIDTITEIHFVIPISGETHKIKFSYEKNEKYESPKIPREIQSQFVNICD